MCYMNKFEHDLIIIFFFKNCIYYFFTAYKSVRAAGSTAAVEAAALPTYSATLCVMSKNV